MTAAPRVVVEDLHKSYGAVEAVKGLSFTAHAGEILGLLGPNGAGKTTAIHVSLGMITPTRGRVSILGLSPFENKYDLYPRINFSSAYAQLPFNLRAEKNLVIFAKLYGVPRPKEKVALLMERFKITHLAGKLTGALSSGEQTRLSLCKSLLNDPEVFFLDEPTASLDPDMADRVREILRGLQQETGMTMIYTSHNMAEVESLCHRVLFVHHGQKVSEGTPAQVLAQFQKESLEKVFIHLARGGELTDAQR